MSSSLVVLGQSILGRLVDSEIAREFIMLFSGEYRVANFIVSGVGPVSE